MKSLKVKICGMREAENIATVASMAPDYMGFIEYRRSPRYVGEKFVVPHEVATAPIRKAGVFVDEEYTVLRRRIVESGYDTVQLHGFETPDYCARIKDDGLHVIKVFRVDDRFDFSETKKFKGKADVLLFDARGKDPGGNGIRFDWNVLSGYHQEIPFFLSGGLRSETLLDDLANLRNMNLYGVDLNSGVETAPGLKHPDKVLSAIDQVRHWK